jgi:hypothetical protein
LDDENWAAWSSSFVIALDVRSEARMEIARL